MPTPSPATAPQLIARARALASTGRRQILGITGAPGAGKSTLADSIVAALGPELAVAVPMDGFHLAQVVLEDLGRADRKGAHDTFDGAGYVALLRRLREQPGHARGAARPAPAAPAGTGTDSALDGVVLAPAFRREIEEPIASAIAVRPEVPLVVTEGNYLLLDGEPWAAIRTLLDESWFVALPDDVRLDRLTRRHVAFGKDPDAAHAWALGPDEANARLIAATAGRADAVWHVT